MRGAVLLAMPSASSSAAIMTAVCSASPAIRPRTFNRPFDRNGIERGEPADPGPIEMPAVHYVLA